MKEKRAKMKLLYVSDSRMPSERANSIQIAKTCEALAKAGCDVTLLLPNRAENKTHSDADIWSYYGIKTKFRIVRLPVKDLAFLEKIHMKKLWFLISTGTFARSVKTFLKENPGFDAVYTRHPESATALAGSKPPGVKLVFEAHKFSDSKLKKIRGVDGIVVLTKPLAELFSQLGKPVSVIPDATDATAFAPGVAPEKLRESLKLPISKVILAYLGRFQTMGEEKGIPEIIASAKSLSPAARGKAFFLFVGGPLSSIPAYERIIAAEGLDRRMFEFRDHVPYGQVKDYLGAVDICLMPFPDTEHYAKYMSPLKMFEYMAAKKPIIASDLPAVREVLEGGKTALLVKPDDPRALAAAESELVADPALRRRLSEAAHSLLSKKYTWPHRAKSIINFISGLQPGAF